MGKIILEFDSFEEKEDARDALDGYKWKLAVWDIDQKLRQTTKYGIYQGLVTKTKFENLWTFGIIKLA